MQQCAEGWHRDHEPDPEPDGDAQPEPNDDDAADNTDDDSEGDGDGGNRRVPSTRRRDDAADLPRVPVEDRTIGRTFTAPDGAVYRPSMFLTLTLGSYGKVGSTSAPINPATYNYRRAALDALHFPKLIDRFWQNLRRCAGYKVQYFAAVEPQKRARTDGPVFLYSRGGWRDRGNVGKAIRKVRGDDFAWVTSHTYRKTVATLLDESGATARMIADQLGHSRVSMTRDVYLGRRAANAPNAVALEASDPARLGDPKRED